MQAFIQRVGQKVPGKRGHALVEYALMLSFLSVMAVGGATYMGPKIEGIVSAFNERIAGALPAANASPAPDKIFSGL